MIRAGRRARKNDSAAIARRVSIEDRYLRDRLDGYVEYSGAVPYRLVPRVW